MTRTFRSFAAGAMLALGVALALQAKAPDSGVVRVKSAYSMEESIARVKADLAAKGITFFNEIDQTALAAKNAGYAIHHRQPRRRPRLAGTPAVHTGRPWSGVGGMDRLQLDRHAARYHQPGAAVRHGHAGGEVHHLDAQAGPLRAPAGSCKMALRGD